MFSGADNALYCPPSAVPVDVSATDFDCTVVFVSQPFGRRIWTGTGGTIVVSHLADFQNSVAPASVTYTNVSAGVYMSGLFITIYTAGTTATGLVLEQ